MDEENQGIAQFKAEITPEEAAKLRELAFALGFNRGSRPDYKRLMSAIANSEYLDTGDRIILTFVKSR